MKRPTPLGRSFNLFWTGQAVSNVGDRITIFVVPTVMIFLLHASPLQVGIVAMAQYLGIPLIGPVAGMLVDRWDNRLTLVMCDVIRLLAVAAMPVAYWLGVLSTPLLFVCVAFVSGCSIVFTVGYLVGRAGDRRQTHLVRAYSRLEGTRSVAEVSGPSIAAALYHALGIAALLVDAASYLVSAICIRSMRPFGESVPDRFGVVAAVARVPAQLGRPGPAPVIAAAVILNSGGPIFVTVMPVLAYRGLGCRLACSARPCRPAPAAP